MPATPTTPQQFVFVSLGTGTGTFVPTAELHAFPDGTVGRTVAADFNKDHAMDVAVVHPDTRSVRLYLGQGDGTFLESPMVLVGTQPELLTAGDWNGDNWTDLAPRRP